MGRGWGWQRGMDTCPALGPGLSLADILASRHSAARQGPLPCPFCRCRNRASEGEASFFRASKEELGFESGFACLHILPSPRHRLTPDPRGILTVSSLPPVTLEGEKPAGVPKMKAEELPLFLLTLTPSTGEGGRAAVSQLSHSPSPCLASFQVLYEHRLCPTDFFQHGHTSEALWAPCQTTKAKRASQ